MMDKTLTGAGWNVSITPVGNLVCLSQSAIPVVLVPNGTIDAAGNITLATALPTTYAQGAFIRLPAGAIDSGQSGLYWCTFSSSTVGVVWAEGFIDPSVPFVNRAPIVSTRAIGSGVAYTQTTAAEITLCNINVPANSIGSNGRLHMTVWGGNNNSAGAKIYRSRISSTLLYERSRSTTIVESWFGTLRNRGDMQRQITMLNNYTNEPASAGTAVFVYPQVDTRVDRQFTVSGQIATATDWIAIEVVSLEILPS